MVEDRTTGQPLGWCGLKQNPWGVDLGFRYFKSTWNKGIATEAGEAVLQWARENKIKGIVGRALSGNVASVRVLKKLGFQEFSRHSMQDFADEHPIPQHDYENWLDQQVIMHKIDL
jgi:RimJ/RimL family protein N-acetyltransferase